MLKPFKWIFQFKYYIIYVFAVIGIKVYADQNNKDIWPSSDETKADDEQSSSSGGSGSSGSRFYRSNAPRHK